MSLMFANQGTAKDCGRKIFRNHWECLAQTIRDIFPSKTRCHLSTISGLKLRACDYFLRRNTSLSGDAIVSLLRSNEGLLVLKALMGDARPDWWATLERAITKEECEREIAQIRKRMDAL